jgi:hypothetical protein
MIILQGITVEKLLEKQRILIDKKIHERRKESEPAAWTYMSRKEVAEHLKFVSPPCKTGQSLDGSHHIKSPIGCYTNRTKWTR